MNLGNSILKVVQESQVSSTDVIIALLLSFALGIIIAQVYRKSFRGISYTESFVVSLVMLTPITAAVMLTIGSNLARAFGLVGALSIIRFRTVVKDTKDIMTVFMSLAIGLAAGTQNYHIAVLGTLLFSLFILFLDRIEFGVFSKSTFLLIFSVPSEGLREQDYKNIIEKYVGKFELLNISSVNTNKKVLEITYKLEGVGTKERQNLYGDLSAMKDISNISIVTSSNFVEY